MIVCLDTTPPENSLLAPLVQAYLRYGIPLLGRFIARDESAYEYLKKIGYKMDVDTRKAQESSEALAAEIDDAFQRRKKAIFHFIDNEEWDLFINVVTETDRLHHYL